MKRRPNNHKKRSNFSNQDSKHRKHKQDNSNKKVKKYGPINTILNEDIKDLEKEDSQ